MLVGMSRMMSPSCTAVVSHHQCGVASDRKQRLEPSVMRPKRRAVDAECFKGLSSLSASKCSSSGSNVGFQASKRRNMAAAAATSGDAGAKGQVDHVVIAGGGIGGLCMALMLQSRGIPFTVYEKVNEYKPFGGPIQLQSNALSTLEALDGNVAEEIIKLGTVTGDRINGLLDGKTGEWYLRFDTRKPAVKKGLPLTLVLNRSVLLDILRKAVDPARIVNGTTVLGYDEDPSTGEVSVRLSSGETAKGDLLIAADGIRSNVLEQMRPGDDAVYSGYTCYTATCDYELEAIDQIGYQVYLGYGQYFVASDVGDGQTQWYAFHKQDPGQKDTSGKVKENLLKSFDGWSEEVLARLHATKEEDMEQRDIYDRRPALSWSKGNVVLLGDAAHAMQPNMGQGGCQAIEDAYHLGLELSSPNQSLSQSLLNYQLKRVPRAAAISGFARSAALMTTTWRPYLGSDPYEFYGAVPGMMSFWENVEKLRIPHPGKVMGQLAMMLAIDPMLEYIACGNPIDEADRVPYCQVPGMATPLRNIPKEAFKMNGIPGFAN